MNGNSASFGGASGLNRREFEHIVAVQREHDLAEMRRLIGKYPTEARQHLQRLGLPAAPPPEGRGGEEEGYMRPDPAP